MTNQEYNKRIQKAADMHMTLLNKELSISEDLQDKKVVAEHKANYKKVIGMLR